MAKKFSGNQQITVTPTSKSTVWQYTGGTTPYEFTLTNSASEIEGYNPEYRSFAVKSKNDIVITTMFATTAGKVKKVTNTIKNYFKDTTADYKVYYSYYTDKPRTHTVRPNTDEGANGLFGTVENAECYLASSAKNASLVTFSADHRTEVLDLKGNDNYKTDHEENITDYFYELAGNDYYRTESGGTIRVNDYSGKDKYEVWGSNSILKAYDYKGNDKYSMISCTGFVINDYAGNDDYRPFLNTAEADRIINDFKGNEYYLVESTSVEINDNSGKDNYQIYKSKVHINDTGKGNDTYGIYDCFNFVYSDNDFTIEDEKGNETYNITGLTFSDTIKKNAIKDVSGNDKYNLKDGESRKVKVEKVNILDESGKDKYNFTVSDTEGSIKNVNIYDNAGADVYTLTGHEDKYIFGVTIYDKSNSKDKYNISKNDGTKIYDYGGNDTYKLAESRWINVIDNAGNDKYTISQTIKNYVTISDKSKGKDSYTFDISKGQSGWVIITDDGGKDSLTLSGVKKDDIVFMSNIIDDETIFNDIFAYDKISRNFACINNFYNVEDNTITGFDDGRIETVKAGKTTLKNVQSEALYQDFNSLKADVVNWLSEAGGGSVYSVLNSGTNYQKDCLVALFTHQDLPPIPIA